MIRTLGFCWIILPLMALCACDEGPRNGTVLVGLGQISLTGPMDDPGTPMFDDDGYVHLERYPLFLLVTVDASDLETPVTSSWPEVVPAERPDEVVLELEVPEGNNRSVTVELLTGDENGMRTWAFPGINQQPNSVSVQSGQTTTVSVTLQELDSGFVTATWDSSVSVASVSWVDATLDAILPPTVPSEGAVLTELTLGRSYWPRVLLSDETLIELQDQIVTLNESSQFVTVTLPLETD